MGALDAIRKNRAKAKKERITFLMTESTKGYLLKLSEQEPERTASAIIADAIRFAYEFDMYRASREINNELRADRGIQKKQAPEGVHRPVVLDKIGLCKKYGGTCDGTNCEYDKYEVTPLGRVVKNRISQPLRIMPETEADFCKSVLGGFNTLSEAEVAFEAETKQ